MKGRLENKLLVESNINSLLDTMPDYMREYYYYLASDKEAKTCIEYLRKVKHFLESLNCNVHMINIQSITYNDISKYFHKISVKTVVKNGEMTIESTSFAYRKLVYNVLKNFFFFLYETNKINDNPMKLIKVVNNTDYVHRLNLTWDDLNNIMNAMINQENELKRKKNQSSLAWLSRDKLIMMLFIYTGMRRTALTEINIEDINWGKKEVKVVDKRAKTHIYPLNNDLILILKQWLRYREEILKGKQEDALFISVRNKRITDEAVYDIVEKYSKLGIGYGISPHKLRGAFITLLHQATGNIELVRQIVGHSNITTTQRYIAQDISAKKKAEDIIKQKINIMM